MVVTERWLPPVGEVLQGRYQLVEYIGKGPIGAVFKAIDLALRRGVALKVLHPAYFEDDRRAVNAFRVQRARAFQHPNIVVFHDMVIPEDGSTPFVTEDLIEGLNLRTIQMLRHDSGDPLSPAEVRFVIEGVASALRWIHQLGVHGNLKPENIFVSGEAVKVTDPFFLVGRAKVRWSTGEDPLADHYLAPEQLLRAGEESRQSDLFALALLTGELVARAAVRPGIPLSAQAEDVSSTLDELFVKATASDPVSRYASVDSFLADLRRAFPMEGKRVVADLGDTTEVPLADVLTAAEIEQIDAVRAARNAERLAAEGAWIPPAMPSDVPASDAVDVAEDLEEVPWHPEAEVASASIRAEGVEALVEPVARAAGSDAADEVTLDWDDELETSAPPAWLSKDGRPLVADDNLFERTLVDTLEDSRLRLEVLRHVRESKAATLARPDGASTDVEQVVGIEELTDSGFDAQLVPAVPPEAADDAGGEAEAPDVETALGEAADTAAGPADVGAPLEDEDSLTATSMIRADVPSEEGEDEIDVEFEDILAEGDAPAEILLDGELDEVLEAGGDEADVELVMAVAEADDADEGLVGSGAPDLSVPGLPEEATDALPAALADAGLRRRATDERPAGQRTSVLPIPRQAGSVAGEAEHATGLPMPEDHDATIVLERARVHIPSQPAADRRVEASDEDLILAPDEEEPILLEGDEEPAAEVPARPERPSYTEDATLDVGMAEVMLVPLRPHPKQAATEAAASARTATGIGGQERAVATPSAPRKGGAGARFALAAGIVLIVGAAIYTYVQYAGTSAAKKGDAVATGNPADGPKPVAVAQAAPDTGLGTARPDDAGAIAAAPDTGAIAAAADAGQQDAGQTAQADTAAQVAAAGDAGKPDGVTLTAQAAEDVTVAGTESSASGDAQSAESLAAEEARKAEEQTRLAAEEAKRAAEEAATRAADDAAAKLAAEEAKKAEEAKRAEEAKKAEAEEAKKLAEAKKAEEAKKLAEAKKAEEAAKKELTPAEIAANEAREKAKAEAKAAALAEKKALAEMSAAQRAEAKRQKDEELRLKKEAQKAAKEEAARKKAEEKAAKEAQKAAVVAAATPDPDDDGDLKCPAGMRKISTSTTRTVAGHKVIEKGAFCIEPYEFPGAGQKPKVNVDWFGATRACEGRGRRLCTSAEWKRGCGGVYPYGKTYDSTACNTMGENGEEREIKPAGSMKRCKSGYGLFDMSGNVSEWTADKTVNGGNAVNDDASATCSRSPKRLESSPASYVGFRCCADPE